MAKTLQCLSTKMWWCTILQKDSVNIVFSEFWWLQRSFLDCMGFFKGSYLQFWVLMGLISTKNHRRSPSWEETIEQMSSVYLNGLFEVVNYWVYIDSSGELASKLSMSSKHSNPAVTLQPGHCYQKWFLVNRQRSHLQHMIQPLLTPFYLLCLGELLANPFPRIAE